MLVHMANIVCISQSPIGITVVIVVLVLYNPNTGRQSVGNWIWHIAA